MWRALQLLQVLKYDLFLLEGESISIGVLHEGHMLQDNNEELYLLFYGRVRLLDAVEIALHPLKVLWLERISRQHWAVSRGLPEA